MKINWKVRLKNKNFWLALIPAALILLQSVASIFGMSFQFGNLGDRLVYVVNSAFSLLAILGIVVDPTTEGVSDSEQALTYDKPKSSHGGGHPVEGE
jgi:phi LC3 family holin